MQGGSRTPAHVAPCCAEQGVDQLFQFERDWLDRRQPDVRGTPAGVADHDHRVQQPHTHRYGYRRKDGTVAPPSSAREHGFHHCPRSGFIHNSLLLYTCKLSPGHIIDCRHDVMRASITSRSFALRAAQALAASRWERRVALSGTGVRDSVWPPSVVVGVGPIVLRRGAE